MSASKKTIGYIVQLGGIASFAAAAFVGGAAAFYVGQKIRTLS